MSDDTRNPEDPAPSPDAEQTSGEPAARAQPASPPLQQQQQQQQPYQAATRSSPWGYVFFSGLLLLLSGLCWWWVEKEVSIILRIWLFVGLVAALSPLFWHIVDVIEAVRSRRGAASGFVILTTVLGVAALGIVTKLNMDKQSGMWSHDTTTTGKYTLGEATEKLLAEIPGTIYITYLEQGSPDLGLREAAQDQLTVYAAVNDRIRLKVMDALREGDRARRYLREVGVTGTSSGEQDDVIVLSYGEPGKEPVPGRHKEVRVERFTWLKMSQLGEMKWLGEQVISDAIMELVFERHKVYATGGHGERAVDEELRTLREALQGQNVAVASQPLDLRVEPKVPDDCDVLLVLDPKTPFSPEEAQAIGDYLERGRMLLFALDVAQQRWDTGLDDLLMGYGVHLRTNYVVIAPYHIAGGLTDVYEPRPLLLIRGKDYGDHPAVSALSARAGFGTAFVESTFLELDDEPPEGVTVEPVVYTPFVQNLDVPGFAARVDSTRRDYTAPNPDTDRIAKGAQRFPLVAAATRQIEKGAGEEDADARVVVMGDTDVLTDRLIAQIPPNLDLGLGLIQWGIRREGLVAVSERTIEQERVELNDYGARVALAWPLGVALLSLLSGGVVWWTRRR